MLELRIERTLGYICPDCDIKPRNYRKLLDEGYWITYSVCPECGRIFNFKNSEDSELSEANKRFEICRELAKSFIIRAGGKQ